MKKIGMRREERSNDGSGLDLPDVVDGGPEIIGTVRECTVGPVFDAESPIVGVMDTHARFIVFQVVATLRVSCRAMEVRTTEITRKKFT